MRSTAFLALIPLSLIGCSAPDSSSSSALEMRETSASSPLAVRTAASAKEYVDISSHLTKGSDVEAWYNLVSNLTQNFDAICGDTFCEGEFSNIESLRYRCSVETGTGTLGTCVWVFAASHEDITTSTGQVAVDTKTWLCKTPLAPNTTVDDFLSALSGPQPLDAKLPGTNQSIYDGLVTCL